MPSDDATVLFGGVICERVAMRLRTALQISTSGALLITSCDSNRARS